MQEKIKQVLSEVHQALVSTYGDKLSRVILFGSQARGDATPGSDIDLLVVLKLPVRPIDEGDRFLEKIVQWNLEYEELVSLIFMEEARFTSEKTPLLLNIRREGVALC